MKPALLSLLVALNAYPQRDLKPEIIAGRRLALAIGNARYRVSPLQNAARDARDFGAFLNQSGFAVTVEENLAGASMRSAIDRFIAGLQPGDEAVFYFAGHGFQSAMENYLAPTDIAITSETEAKRTSVALLPLVRRISRAGVALNLIIVDACRNNPFPRGAASPSGLAAMEAALGSAIALAAGPGQKADDNAAGQNGLFTAHLLDVFRSPAPLAAGLRRVREMVYRASGSAQRPWVHDDLIGDYYFQPAARTEPRLGELSRQSRHALVLFSRDGFSEAAGAFEKIRRAYPDDPYAHNAAGASYARQGLYALAVPCYTRAIELKPDYAAAYYNRGIAYLRAARYDLAIQDFTWSLETDAADPVVLALRGEAWFLTRRYDRAEEDLAESLRLNPYDAHALFTMGSLLERLSRIQEAVRKYDEAITIKPDFVEASDRKRELSRRAR